MKAHVAVAVLLAAAALAGCSDGGDDGPGGDGPDGGGTTRTSTTTSAPRPTAPPTPTPRPPITQFDLLLDFDLTGCSGLALAQAVPLEQADALLPDGFTAAPFILPALEQSSGQALLVVDLFRCNELSTPATTIPALWFGHVFTFVEAPTERYPDRVFDKDAYEYMFQVLAGPDVLAQIWPVAGYDTHVGNASIQDTTGLGTWQAALGDYAWSSIIPPIGESDQGTFTFERYTVIEGGDTLVWNGTEAFPAGTLGIGSVDVPAGSPFSGQGIVEADRLDGQSFLFGGASYTDMDLSRVLAEPI